MPAFLGLGPDNPVAWCNFYRKGGFKTLLTTGGAYAGIILVLIFLSVRVNPQYAASAYGNWIGILLGLQFVFTVIIGASRVSNTIRGDANSGMLESLRMMPLPAGHAVVGYLSSAAATCAAVLAGAPEASFARRTRIALPATSTPSGRFAPGRSTNSTVMSLPPSWPQAAELTTTALCPVPPIVACAFRW